MLTTALREFKRHFLHEVRNGKTTEEAGDMAVPAARDIVLGELVKQFPQLSTEQRIEEWEKILPVLVTLQLILINLPLDKSRLHMSSFWQDITKNPDKPHPNANPIPNSVT